MSITTDAREALFIGKDDIVRSIYERHLEALHANRLIEFIIKESHS